MIDETEDMRKAYLEMCQSAFGSLFDAILKLKEHNDESARLTSNIYNAAHSALSAVTCKVGINGVVIDDLRKAIGESKKS